MRKTKLVLGLAVICLALVTIRSQMSGQEPGRVKASTFMRLKLDPAKGALEGIALADFEMISKNAGENSKSDARRKLDGGANARIPSPKQRVQIYH